MTVPPGMAGQEARERPWPSAGRTTTLPCEPTADRTTELSCRPRCWRRTPRGDRMRGLSALVTGSAWHPCQQTQAGRSCRRRRWGKTAVRGGPLGVGGATVPLVPRRGPDSYLCAAHCGPRLSALQAETPTTPVTLTATLQAAHACIRTTIVAWMTREPAVGTMVAPDAPAQRQWAAGLGDR